MKQFYVFAAVKHNVHVCFRGTEMGLLEHDFKIKGMLVIGDYLAVVDEHTLKVWNYKDLVKISSIDLPDYANVTVLMHPDTYVNKVLLGTEEGVMLLYNVNTKKLLYTFEGWGSKVVTIVQSPAIDIVAIGLADGRIILHNIKLDKTLMTFNQETAVTGLSFRSGILSLLY